MEAKQTAVEYLTNELYSYLAEEYLSLTIWNEISEKIAYAKSLEQKQIMDAYMDSYGNTTEPEDYYNQTYGKENKL